MVTHVQGQINIKPELFGAVDDFFIAVHILVVWLSSSRPPKNFNCLVSLEGLLPFFFSFQPLRSIALLLPMLLLVVLPYLLKPIQHHSPFHAHYQVSFNIFWSYNFIVLSCPSVCFIQFLQFITSHSFSANHGTSLSALIFGICRPLLRWRWVDSPQKRLDQRRS